MVKALLARAGDELQCGARVLPAHVPKRHEFLRRGKVRRGQTAVTITMGRCRRRRESEASGGESLVEDPAHLAELFLGGTVGQMPPGPITWRRMAE